MKIPIGLVIKQIMEERGIKAQALANALGVTKQAVYQSAAKMSMSDTEINRWAKALDVEPTELISRWKGENNSKNANQAPDLLSDQMARIEKMFQDQIEIKDRQIEALNKMVDNSQRTIELLLGKSEGVSSGPSASRKKLLLPGSFYDTFGYTQVTA